MRRLMLFLAGEEEKSLLARENLRKLCDGEPGYDFDVCVVDVLQDHQLALKHGVLVIPCLIMIEPSPQVTVIGTLQDTRKVRVALRLKGE